MNNRISPLYFLCGVFFATSIIVSNIVEQKLITIWIIPATAGLLVFPISYIINDIVAEVWGYRNAKRLIWLGFLMNAFSIIIFQITIWLPQSQNMSNTHQEAIEIVLGSTMRISIASFIAFLCGSFLNAYVMSKMKLLQKGKGFSIRAVLSTIVGETADSVIFFSLAFLFLIPIKSIAMLIVSQIAMKTLYEIMLLPVTQRVVKLVKKKENTDVYDVDISYNPFK